jgi:DNA-binding MarR family transcriptional regulator
VSFREGKLAFAQLGQEDTRLASVLYRANRLTAGQYKAIQLRGQASDKELGLLLINAGYLTQDEILGSLQSYFTEVIRRLFTWVEGFFRFDNDAPAPEDRISIRLDLENLIIEGSRQLREWEQLQDEIPSLDMALKFTDRPGTNIRNINLSVEEWRVVSYINPRNSIRQIATATKLNDMEIRRIVYGLIQAGLVELIRPQGAPPPRRDSVRTPTSVDTEQQKSLVNRLITRIRAM